MKDSQGNWWIKGSSDYWWLKDREGNVLKKDSDGNMWKMDRIGNVWKTGPSTDNRWIKDSKEENPTSKMQMDVSSVSPSEWKHSDGGSDSVVDVYGNFVTLHEPFDIDNGLVSPMMLPSEDNQGIDSNISSSSPSQSLVSSRRNHYSLT